jgi:hypothetical protein
MSMLCELARQRIKAMKAGQVRRRRDTQLSHPIAVLVEILLANLLKGKRRRLTLGLFLP